MENSIGLVDNIQEIKICILWIRRGNA